MGINFENDKFERKKIVDYIYKIIENKDMLFNNNEGLILGINSPWGTGKTTFLDMWEKELKDKEEYTLIRYNSWEDDDYDNPFVPIMSKVIECVDKDNKTKLIENSLKIGKIVGISIGKNLLTKIIGEKLKNLQIDFVCDNLKDLDKNQILKFFKLLSKLSEENGLENLKKEMSDVVDVESIVKNIGTQLNFGDNDFFKEYTDFKKIKDELRNNLKAGTKNKKILFVIDELDRCRPLYAIKTLEVIKHYFGIENITFVFALDMEQLKHSIATVYGQNMDSYGYLRRFFNHIIKLPNPDIKKYIEHIDGENGILHKADIIDSSSSKEYLDFLAEIFKEMDLSFRDIDVIYSNIKIFYLLKMKDNEFIKNNTNNFIDDTYKDKNCASFKFYSYLIILKYKCPELYDILINRNFEIVINGTPNTNNFYVINNIDFGNIGLENQNILKFHKSLASCENKKKLSYWVGYDNSSITPEQRNFFRACVQITKIENNYKELTLGSYIEKMMETVIF